MQRTFSQMNGEFDDGANQGEPPYQNNSYQSHQNAGYQSNALQAMGFPTGPNIMPNNQQSFQAGGFQGGMQQGNFQGGGPQMGFQGGPQGGYQNGPQGGFNNNQIGFQGNPSGYQNNNHPQGGFRNPQGNFHGNNHGFQGNQGDFQGSQQGFQNGPPSGFQQLGGFQGNIPQGGFQGNMQPPFINNPQANYPGGPQQNFQQGPQGGFANRSGFPGNYPAGPPGGFQGHPQGGYQSVPPQFQGPPQGPVGFQGQGFQGNYPNPAPVIPSGVYESGAYETYEEKLSRTSGYGGRGGGGRGEKYARGEGGGRFGGRQQGSYETGRGTRGPKVGGRGFNRHMGNVTAVQNLTASFGFSDEEILEVVSPGVAELEYREALVAASSTTLPPHDEWRFMGRQVGARLDGPSHVVRANHFMLQTQYVPVTIFQYHVHVYRVLRDEQFSADVASKEDPRVTFELMKLLRSRHPEWETYSQQGIGFTYDGRTFLYTTVDLKLPELSDKMLPQLSEIIGLMDIDDVESKYRKYKVTLTQVNLILPPTTFDGWTHAPTGVLSSLDISLLNFARVQQASSTPDWFTVGCKIFSAYANSFFLSPGYTGSKGYFASLKSCLAGTALVLDMTVNCFLASGEMPELLYTAGGYHDFASFYQDCMSPRGLAPHVVAKINKIIKNCKVKAIHLGHSRKAKELGPRADSQQTCFEFMGSNVTVAQYFELMCRSDPKYSNALPYGRLKYPELPTVNIGTNNKPVFIPAELLSVPGGQNRSMESNAAITTEMIKSAAVRPNERFKYITEGEEIARNTTDSIIQVLRQDSNARAFGLGQIDTTPIVTQGKLLPPAKLQYGQSQLDPKLDGVWNIDRPQQSFVKLPPQPHVNGYSFGVLVVGEKPPQEQNWEETIERFCDQLVADSGKAGVRLVQIEQPILHSNDKPEGLTLCLKKLKNFGVRIVIVIMLCDAYGAVKLVSDKMGLSTQCVRWKILMKEPRGLHWNLMLKINTKLGGTNHTLASRLSPMAFSEAQHSTTKVFQEPPASLSWVFDKRCMMVGVDVSHAEPGSDRQSMAAVVASMDGCASQYIAHLSAQTSRVEMVSALQDAMVSLLTAFKSRNGGIPEHIIVYRDGVSEGQFSVVIEKELPAIQGALELLGYSRDAAKVSIIVCQKGHHTRLVYEEIVPGTDDRVYINPCPGLCVDAMGGNSSVCSAVYNEFYLNSHSAVQGTSKPCKYSLIYDEIGFKMMELELLTYWSTYLYARCNKSVSYATPAYYAHWASKRGKDLFSAGGTPQDLLDISELWARTDGKSTMFFI